MPVPQWGDPYSFLWPKQPLLGGWILGGPQEGTGWPWVTQKAEVVPAEVQASVLARDPSTQLRERGHLWAWVESCQEGTWAPAHLTVSHPTV